MATQVGSLYTSITLESSSFISNMKRAATATEQGAAQINKAFALAKTAAVGFIGLDLARSLVASTKSALDFNDAIVDMSDRIGASTRVIQEFRYAAQLSGSSTADADAALDKFTKTLGAAQRGTGAQADLFKRLGVETKNADGSYRSLDSVLKSYADAVAKLPTVQQRNAATLEAMGKSAGTLTALLSGGSKGFADLATEAEKFGAVVDDQALRATGPLNDELDRMKFILDANFATAVGRNADELLYLAGSVTALANSMIVGSSTAVKYYRGLADIYKKDGIFAAAAEAFFGSDESAQNTVARGAALAGTFRMKGFIEPETGRPGALDRTGDRPERPKIRQSAAITPKAVEDIYKGLSAAQVRNGGLDKLQDVLGRDGFVAAGLDASLAKAIDFSKVMTDIGQIATNIPEISPITVELQAQTDKFAESLSSGLGQALVYGQSLGDALVNSIKAAAAELVTSNLLALLKGGEGGGLLTGVVSFANRIFGGGAAGGGPVKGGYSYDVGELGRERVVIPANGQIIPNKMLMGGGGGMVIQVDARGSTDPAAVRNQVQLGILEAAPTLVAAARGNTIQNIRRPRLPGGGRA